MRFVFIFLSVLLLLFSLGCVQPSELKYRDTSSIPPSPQIRSFQSLSDSASVCLENGKPLILMFSTTTCPHCLWVNDTFNGVMKEYLDKNLVVVRHWEVDIGDDQFTPKRDSKVLEKDVALFEKVNPDFSVPTYVFGCKYYRVGNAFEVQGDLDAEAGEFKAVVEKLLLDANAVIAKSLNI